MSTPVSPSAAAHERNSRGDEEKSRATGSAAGETPHARTESIAGSDAWNLTNATQLPGGAGGMRGGSTRLEISGLVELRSTADVRALIGRLEELQAHPTLKSPQQPPSTKRYLVQRSTGVDAKGGVNSTLEQHSSTTEIEMLIEQAIDAYPEMRLKLASLTKSGWLRQKILGYQPKGARGAGCSTLGNGNGHPWRGQSKEIPMYFTDHNWPKVAVNPHGSSLAGSHLPGGDSRHSRLLRCPVDKLPIHPALEKAPDYSLSRDKRWWGCKENGELDKAFQQNRMPPGPGAFCKSAPRGPHFSVDAGETVVLGANHPCPWKSPMGQSINPNHIHVLSEHHSAPKWSFSKTRRSVSDTRLGHGQQAGGPVKSDEGCLSPGHVYELYTSFSAGPGLRGKRRTRSTQSVPRMRMQAVPPEPDPGTTSQAADDFMQTAVWHDA